LCHVAANLPQGGAGVKDERYAVAFAGVMARGGVTRSDEAGGVRAKQAVTAGLVVLEGPAAGVPADLRG